MAAPATDSNKARERQIGERLLLRLSRKFGIDDLDLVAEALVPRYIPITKIDSQVRRFGNGYGVLFECAIDLTDAHIVPGRSGKVVPKAFIDGDGKWTELIKYRIHEVKGGTATGELHFGKKSRVVDALVQIRPGDYLEVDQSGVSSRLESSLAESAFRRLATRAGFAAIRKPEDIAKHLGTWSNYDFDIEKDGIRGRVEVKSLWGTDTAYARLIHSKGEKGGKRGGRAEVWETSSCRFTDQDIFAVNLWLKTGSIFDFAYALSVGKDARHPYGLPCAKKRSGKPLKDYVHQNPLVKIGDETWVGTISEVWNLYLRHRSDMGHERVRTFRRARRT